MGEHTPGHGTLWCVSQDGRYIAAITASATKGGEQSTVTVWEGIKVGNHRVLANYESLSELTAQMREAAVRGEWDHLIDLEQQCRRHVDAMKQADAETTLDEPSQQRKVRLIKKILAHDADIRSRTVAWMGQLQSIMQSNRQEQRLQQAYGA